MPHITEARYGASQFEVSADLDALVAYPRPASIAMFVAPVDDVAVYVYHVFPAYGNRIPGLVLLSNPLGEEPVQNREVNVEGRIPDAVPPQFSRVDAVLKPVQLHKPVIQGLNAQVLPTQVPLPRDVEIRVSVITNYCIKVKYNYRNF